MVEGVCSYQTNREDICKSHHHAPLGTNAHITGRNQLSCHERWSPHHASAVGQPDQTANEPVTSGSSPAGETLRHPAGFLVAHAQNAKTGVEEMNEMIWTNTWQVQQTFLSHFYLHIHIICPVCFRFLCVWHDAQDLHFSVFSECNQLDSSPTI